MILSTVRSKPWKEINNKNYAQPDHSWMTENLGLVTDRHLINVGITRSKHGLVITGINDVCSFLLRLAIMVKFCMCLCIAIVVNS